MNIANDLGAREVEQVGIAGKRPGVLFEALAAVGVLAAHTALNERAVRPVEDEDAGCGKLGYAGANAHRFPPAQTERA